MVDRRVSIVVGLVETFAALACCSWAAWAAWVARTASYSAAAVVSAWILRWSSSVMISSIMLAWLAYPCSAMVVVGLARL